MTENNPEHTEGFNPIKDIEDIIFMFEHFERFSKTKRF